MQIKEFITNVKDLIKRTFRKLFINELPVDGEKAPKTYAYGKKFYGIYLLFLLSSFILIFAINFPQIYLNNELIKNIFFVIGNGIITLFLVLSFLFSNSKVREFIFEGKTVIKQLVLYSGIFIGFFILFLYIFLAQLNLSSYLLALSTIWLILLSTRFYMYSRKYATKIETRLIKKYSFLRRVGAFITPYFILTVLVFIALLYRAFLVFISLDFFAQFAQAEAVDVYKIEMKLVMPLIYFSLILTLLFIIFEFVFTRRKAETRRAGLFDNYTFSLIIFFIFFFQILQVTMFLMLNNATMSALKASFGATGSGALYSWIIVLVEFGFSMFFLYRIIKKLGRSIGWRLFVFKEDGLILLILGCVLSQTLTRFAFLGDITSQTISNIGQFFMADKYVVSIIMIIFLGVTLLIYYIKPHETSMFIRLQKETVSKEQDNIEIVYNLIRNEYIRRGESYPIEILERELIKATHLPKSEIYSLINKIDRQNMNITITEETDDIGIPKKIVDFTSVTEKFDNRVLALKKAKKYLSERLYNTISEKREKFLELQTNSDSQKASDIFLSSLSTDYTKKQRDQKVIDQKKKTSEISFTQREIPISLKAQIIDILKKEYIYRIENVDKYPEFYFPISEMAAEIQFQTRITPGELYPILDSINQTDLEFTLLDNPEEPEDKFIAFFPVADDNLNYAIENFRVDEFKRIKKEVTKTFIKVLKRKKSRSNINKLRRDINGKDDLQHSWNQILKILYDYYPKVQEEQERLEKGAEFEKILNSFPKKNIDIFL
ncbi:MAG: hypothetical protein ACFFKA_14365 [Candidatus Thorarchaeota archaeon]